jgi:hypothetical protein
MENAPAVRHSNRSQKVSHRSGEGEALNSLGVTLDNLDKSNTSFYLKGKFFIKINDKSNFTGFREVLPMQNQLIVWFWKK